jgi:hypothetical protein
LIEMIETGPVLADFDDAHAIDVRESRRARKPFSVRRHDLYVDRSGEGLGSQTSHHLTSTGAQSIRRNLVLVARRRDWHPQRPRNPDLGTTGAVILGRVSPHQRLVWETTTIISRAGLLKIGARESEEVSSLPKSSSRFAMSSSK